MEQTDAESASVLLAFIPCGDLTTPWSQLDDVMHPKPPRNLSTEPHI
jgi:hypothetical protein